LNDAQKAANTVLSQIRIFIEHAIGGMKRYNILEAIPIGYADGIL
jgi:hypothetical protein